MLAKPFVWGDGPGGQANLEFVRLVWKTIKRLRKLKEQNLDRRAGKSERNKRMWEDMGLELAAGGRLGCGIASRGDSLNI
jgi:hypothetical protein